MAVRVALQLRVPRRRGAAVGWRHQTLGLQHQALEDFQVDSAPTIHCRCRTRRERGSVMHGARSIGEELCC
eukprot:1779623-Rhodomonas_salina.3